VNMCTESREETPRPVLAEHKTRQKTACAVIEEVGASPSRRRRFDRASIGFWLGGISLGTVGCILGAYMPYHHPVALAISAIWWGIYAGCFGASLGALFGFLTTRDPRSGGNQTPVVPRSPERDSPLMPRSPDRGVLGGLCHNGAAGQPPTEQHTATSPHSSAKEGSRVA
jgi:hypothetical protein